MKKLFLLLTAVLLSAWMGTYAWVSVTPTGSANTAPSISYVKLTSKGNTSWQVDFYGTSGYCEFRVVNLTVSTKPSGVLNGRFPYSQNNSNYAYNSSGNSLFSKNFKGEIGFVYLGYEDSNGWPVYHVSGIAVSNSTGNYCIYAGDFPVRMYDSNGSTRYTGTIDNDTYEHTAAHSQYTFTSPNVINSTWWQYADWGYNDDYLLEIEAYNLSRNSNNYCKINFWVNNSGRKDYNGRSGPLEGAYPVQSPYISGNCYYRCYWVIDNSINTYAVGYSTSNQVGDCQANSYTANVVQSGSSYNFSSISTFEEVLVDVGKYDKYYIRAYKSAGQLWAVIGEPAYYTITFNDYNGTQLQSSNWERKFTPKYTGSTPTRTGYTFTGWSPTIEKAMGNATYTAAYSAVTYTITYNGLEGATNINPTTYTIETQTINLTNPGERDGYNFIGWTMNGEPITKIPVGSTGDLIVTANWELAITTYDITITSDPDHGTVNKSNITVEEGSTITIIKDTIIIGENIIVATPNDNDSFGYNYVFNGWINTNGEMPETVTEDLTISANFRQELHIILQENEEDSYYDDFQKYDNVKTTTVTLNRQFKKGVWSTLCLPFDVNKAMMTSLRMSSRVYEFKYATGNADLGGGLNLYFAQAQSIKAGIPYIVNANESLASKTSFVFSNVTINTIADSVPTLASLDDYNHLGGHKSSGTIELVGTMRNGILKGTETGNTYMGLKDNHVYYPNIELGSTIYAYRAVFRSNKALNTQRIRIVVEDMTDGFYELTLDGDKIFDTNKKFIKDGYLYIEYNGVIYDATGRIIHNVGDN